MIEALIDKQDNFEVVRDQIATILKAESLSQQALATAAGQDPSLWALRVFVERSNPWEAWLEPEPGADVSPIVNVWYDNSSFDRNASNVSERQKSSSTYNVDCYGYGVSSPDGEGHKPGDREAAYEMQRAVRLVRNILMSDQYPYLGLRGTVWGRWPQSITSFQPENDQVRVQNVIASRIVLRVDFNEFSPQTPGNALELISTEIKRASTGELLAEVETSFPLT